jgi:hypothetical protein
MSLDHKISDHTKSVSPPGQVVELVNIISFYPYNRQIKGRQGQKFHFLPYPCEISRKIPFARGRAHSATHPEERSTL